MKKILFILTIVAATAFAACNNSTTSEGTSTVDSTCVDSCATDSTCKVAVDTTVKAVEVK